MIAAPLQISAVHLGALGKKKSTIEAHLHTLQEKLESEVKVSEIVCCSVYKLHSRLCLLQ
jgi:hypothetical protein